MMRLFVFVLAIILFIYVSYSAACAGFKLRINSINNCAGDAQIISFDKNLTSVLSSNCEVSAIGCITSKGFTKAMVKFSILKNGIVVMSGTSDMCSVLNKKNEEAKARLAMFGFPTECTSQSKRICFEGDKKINVTKYKNYLAVANGKMEFDAEIEHDTGKSCLKMKFELYK